MRAAVLVLVVAAWVVAVVAVAVVTGSDKWATVLVAFGAGIAVAWQSFETRRAAGAAEKALRTADESLRISQVLAIEAERQRLDADAPRLLVRIEPPEWPPRVGRQYVGSEPAQLPPGEMFRLPKDGPRHVMLRADGSVHNEGNRTARVTLQGMRTKKALLGDQPWSELGAHQIDVIPDGNAWFRLEAEFPAGEWIANAEAAERSEPQRTKGTGFVVAMDDADNGVMDLWEVEVSGQPLERVPDEQASWRLPRIAPAAIPIVSAVGPRVRHYYRSKSNQRELPGTEVPVRH